LNNDQITQFIKEDLMAYFLYQSALVTSIAFIAGAIIGWWLHHHHSKESSHSNDSDLGLVKNYLAESIKENARLKLQQRNMEEKIDKLSNNTRISDISSIDFEAFQAFEETMKEAQMRKYLN